MTYCAGATEDGRNPYNVVDVRTTEGIGAERFTLRRNFYTTSSCGLCGKASLDAVRTVARRPLSDRPCLTLSPDLPASLPDGLRRTGPARRPSGGCSVLSR
ncbi:hypothetical protein GCM10010300_71530 [Streptomyces olivaceoviridis]|uniref:hypothetical protein n=1 Tax=Streptomyces olivaceoviridis TaxID=1921 RepID=UPI001677C0D1|nr:hypothetical protein GCM10010300_71530 [Streptomyces olivaceoviridis]